MVEKNSVFHDMAEEDEEEALSLCDLPLDQNDTEFDEATNNHGGSSTRTSRTRRSLSQPPELFEFLSSLSSSEIMCPAEDMIFCGRIISSQPIKALSRDGRKPQPSAFRRRSESLSELHTTSTTRSNSNKTSNNILRSSRSLDYQKLRRFSSSKNSLDSDMERNPSVRRSDRVKKAVKPRWWYLFMFGMVKFPPEMDLQDIKSRQFRRNASSVMFPPSESDRNFQGHRDSGKSSWKFLKALSCKDHASIAVTTSFYVPNV